MLESFNNSDFSSVLVDYTSALTAQGSASFTYGQNEGTGTYTTGSAGATLSEDNYYWRIKTIDENNGESELAAKNYQKAVKMGEKYGDANLAVYKTNLERVSKK